MSSTSASAAASTPHPKEVTEYGKLPFDRFVLDHWEYERQPEEDQQQWNEFAQKWLSMDHLGRSPYHEIAFQLSNAPADDYRMPTQEQIKRCLEPHQTADERNRASATRDCLCIRTCYGRSLAPAYEEMIRHKCMDIFEASSVLDDKNLYNFEEDWSKILLRMPQLPDVVPYCNYPEDEDKDFMDDKPEDEALLPIWKAELKWRSVHYILDREAQEKRLLKVIWLDLQGNCVWWNWMTPIGTQNFEALRHGLGKGFSQVMDLAIDFPQYREKGALLQTSD